MVAAEWSHPIHDRTGPLRGFQASPDRSRENPNAMMRTKTIAIFAGMVKAPACTGRSHRLVCVGTWSAAASNAQAAASSAQPTTETVADAVARTTARFSESLCLPAAPALPIDDCQRKRRHVFASLRTAVSDTPWRTHTYGALKPKAQANSDPFIPPVMGPLVSRTSYDDEDWPTNLHQCEAALRTGTARTPTQPH